MKNYLFASPIAKGGIVGLSFPVGIACVAAALRDTGRPVIGFNPAFSTDPDHDFENIILEKNIDILCIGGMSTYYNQIENMINLAKSIRPTIITVLGGSLVSTEPEVVIGNIGADYGIIGQGEITIVELAKALEETSKEDLAIVLPQVDGLVYKDANGIVYVNKCRRDIDDLDAMPFPAYDLFNITEYIEKTGILPIVGSRSCPYQCTFCYHSSGTKYRQRSLDNIFAEIDHWKNNKIELLFITDELFSTNKSRVYEFCDRIKEYGIKFYFQARPDDLDEEMVIKLKESGCALVTIGIESADDDILKSMKKHVTFAQIENVLKILKKYDLHITGNFIFGDIEETQISVDKTLTWYNQHPEYFVNLIMIRVLPGSYLYEYAVSKGLIPDRLAFIKKGCPLVNVSKLTDEQYRSLNDKIDNTRNERTPFAQNLQISKIYDDNSASISMECPICGTVNTAIVLDITRENGQQCRSCGELMRIYPYGLIDKKVFAGLMKNLLNEYFRPYAERGDRIVAYGISDISKAMYIYSANFRNCLISFSSADNNAFPDGLYGVPVISPEKIKLVGADYLVIDSIKYFDEIRQYIEKELKLKIPVIDLRYK